MNLRIRYKEGFVVFLNFIIVGFLATSVDYFIYQILIQADLNLNVSKGISYSAGIIAAYIGNTFFTFRTKRSNPMLFCLVYFVGFLINVSVNYLVNIGLGKESANLVTFSWVIATISSATTNFLMLKRWVYKIERPRE